MDLVDDRVLVPERIVRERRRGEDRLGEVFLLDRGHRVSGPGSAAGCAPGACRARARSRSSRAPASRVPPSSRSVATTPRPGSRPSAPRCSRSVPARRAWGSRLTTVTRCRARRRFASSTRAARRRRCRGTRAARSLERRVLAADPVDARISGARLVGSSRSQSRIWYFSESRYSSLPGSRGTCSSSSKAGP